MTLTPLKPLQPISTAPTLEHYNRLFSVLDNLVGLLGAANHRDSLPPALDEALIKIINTLEESPDPIPVTVQSVPTRPHAIQREWTWSLPIRQQAVLLAAIRGCDGAPKDDPSKSILWALRWDILHPSSAGINPTKTKSFMGIRPSLYGDVGRFLSSLDQYPLHFVMHLCHAAEIIGYKHPDDITRAFWRDLYETIATDNLHMTPETVEEMDARLCDEPAVQEAINV